MLFGLLLLAAAAAKTDRGASEEKIEAAVAPERRGERDEDDAGEKRGLERSDQAVSVEDAREFDVAKEDVVSARSSEDEDASRSRKKEAKKGDETVAVEKETKRRKKKRVVDAESEMVKKGSEGEEQIGQAKADSVKEAKKSEKELESVVDEEVSRREKKQKRKKTPKDSKDEERSSREALEPGSSERRSGKKGKKKAGSDDQSAQQSDAKKKSGRSGSESEESIWHAAGIDARKDSEREHAETRAGDENEKELARKERVREDDRGNVQQGDRDEVKGEGAVQDRENEEKRSKRRGKSPGKEKENGVDDERQTIDGEQQEKERISGEKTDVNRDRNEERDEVRQDRKMRAEEEGNNQDDLQKPVEEKRNREEEKQDEGRMEEDLQKPVEEKRERDEQKQDQSRMEEDLQKPVEEKEKSKGEKQDEGRVEEDLQKPVEEKKETDEQKQDEGRMEEDLQKPVEGKWKSDGEKQDEDRVEGDLQKPVEEKRERDEQKPDQGRMEEDLQKPAGQKGKSEEEKQDDGRGEFHAQQQDQEPGKGNEWIGEDQKQDDQWKHEEMVKQEERAKDQEQQAESQEESRNGKAGEWKQASEDTHREAGEQPGPDGKGPQHGEIEIPVQQPGQEDGEAVDQPAHFGGERPKVERINSGGNSGFRGDADVDIPYGSSDSIWRRDKRKYDSFGDGEMRFDRKDKDRRSDRWSSRRPSSPWDWFSYGGSDSDFAKAWEMYRRQRRDPRYGSLYEKDPSLFPRKNPYDSMPDFSDPSWRYRRTSDKESIYGQQPGTRYGVGQDYRTPYDQPVSGRYDEFMQNPYSGGRVNQGGKRHRRSLDEYFVPQHDGPDSRDRPDVDMPRQTRKSRQPQMRELPKNTMLNDDNVLVCQPGYVSDGDIAEKGCWKCDIECGKQARCQYPGVCKCIDPYQGDGVSCSLPPPVITRTQKLKNSQNVLVEFAGLDNVQAKKAFCKFEKVIVIGEVFKNHTISCALPDGVKFNPSLQLSFDGVQWSDLESVTTFWLLSDEFLEMWPLFAVIAVVFVILMAICICCCGKKKKVVVNPRGFSPEELLPLSNYQETPEEGFGVHFDCGTTSTEEQKDVPFPEPMKY